MVGRKSISADATIPGTRSGSTKLAHINVFPHTECDVLGQFDQLAIAFRAEDKRWRLEKYIAGDLRNRFNPGHDSLYYTILSTNPWAIHPESSPMPQGRAGGTTDVWVFQWHCVDRGFWAQLNNLIGEKKPPGYDAFLEVSCLTWHYSGTSEYESDIVIELYEPEYPGDLRPYYVEHDRHLREAARHLAEQIESYLKSVQPSAG